MGICRMLYRRLKKKGFQILLLLTAFASVSVWVRVQQEATTEENILSLRDNMDVPLKAPRIALPHDPTEALEIDVVRTSPVEQREPHTYPVDAGSETWKDMTTGEILKELVAESATTGTMIPVSTTPSIHTPSTLLGPTQGFLNQHVWDNVCSFRVESMRELILFPNLPSRRRFLTSFQTKATSRNFGERIFGFVHPDVSGLYQFAVSSNDNSELWFSSDDTPNDLRRIANIGSWNKSATTAPGKYTQLPSQISTHVNLTKGKKYFIELLHKQKDGISHAEVSWKKPGESGFTVITSEYISAFLNDSHMTNNSVSVRDYTETPRKPRDYTYEVYRDVTGRGKLGAVLPSCPYEPTYLVAHKLARFEGARNKTNTHFAAVYPADTSNETLPLVQRDDNWWQENNYGNPVVDEGTVHSVVRRFVQALEQKYPSTYALKKILSVEAVEDSSKGKRYLLDLILTDNQTGTELLFSDFVYIYESEDKTFCFPERFRWRPRAMVNVIVPVKDAGRWALYFIRNMAEILQETSDTNVHLIIIDYDSQDIDVDAVLQASSVVSYTVLKLPREQKFIRSDALQLGADAVKDPHSILFLCDLHLSIPSKLINLIRKHCVEGKMAFAPVVKRLRCGFYPKLPAGYWETLGFGLFALYKSDFERIGGMNSRRYKGWGGEDWDLLDRVLMSRMEVERLKIPNFYHFYHPFLTGHNNRIGA